MFAKARVAAALLCLSASLGAQASQIRRDEVPANPYDPSTTTYCSWWFDNDGSIPCTKLMTLWSITLADFRRWNPSIDAQCSNLEKGKSYCVEAFSEPPPPTQVPTSSTPIPTSKTTTAGAPGPTQPGQIATCNRWDFVNENDNCSTFIQKYPGLTLKDLVAWNSGIGDNCQLMWAGAYLCTGVPGFSPVIPSSTAKTSSTAPTPTNGIATPTPIQPGMVDNCDAFHFVTDSDICSTIVKKYGISLSQFYTWNPKVGTDCGGLWLGVNVCVSIVGVGPTTPVASATPSPTPTKPSNGVATPTPIQSGMIDKCNKFHFVADGDICSSIAAKYGISFTQFYNYNPGVSKDCSTLWLGAYVCVGIIGSSPAPTTLKTSTTTQKPTTTSTGNGVATPTPAQPGMVTNCKTFYFVKDGDNCSTIAKGAGISIGNFYKWNTGVGSNCETLWLGAYVCIATL